MIRARWVLRFDLVMGLGNKLNKFNFGGDTDHLAHADGDPRGDEGDGLGSVSCSICLETVAKDGDRAWANLQCGHQFHLGNVPVLCFID